MLVAGGAVARAGALGRVVAATSPTVTSISVTELNRDETTQATIDGTGFASGTKVSLGPGVKVKVTARTTSTLRVLLSVSASADVGGRPLHVTVPHEGTATLSKAVHLDYAPVFTQWAVGQGATGWTTTLVRPTFTTAPSMTFTGTGVTVASRTLNGSGQVQATFDIAGAAAATWRGMLLVDGASSWLVPNGLKVRGAPKIVSVTPLGQGESDQTVKVQGQGFEVCAGPPPKEPVLTVSGPGVTVNSVSSALGTLLYANLSVAPGTAIGPRDVTITNCSSGGTATWNNVFSVLGAPRVTSVPAIALGVSRMEVVRGTNFAPGTTLSAGSGVTFSNVLYLTPTRLRATIAVAPSAATGLRDVTATDNGGATTTAFNLLSIDPLPTESSLGPLGVGANTAVVLTVTGTGFEQGATVTAIAAGHVDHEVEFGPARVVSSTELKVIAAAKGDVSLGSVAVEVTNPDGGGAGTLQLATDPAPLVTSVASSTTAPGAIVVHFTAPAGAPTGDTYAVDVCKNAAMKLGCSTVATPSGGGPVTRLVAATRYFVVVVSKGHGSTYPSRSNVAGPVAATARLAAPTSLKVLPSAKVSGAVAVGFTPPANAPKSQLYAATACRNVQMTGGCVTADVARGGTLRGLVQGASYHVQVHALASAGFLASATGVSGVVHATVQLKAPVVTSATLSGGDVTVGFSAPSNRPPGQRYALLACKNAAMSSGCVQTSSYKAGESVPFKGSTCFVRVTALASSGYLASASKNVAAKG
jgi:hypothetical protein